MRLQYPTNVRVIEVPCTGKVDIIYILRPLSTGSMGSSWRAAWKATVITWGVTSRQDRVKRAKEILDKVGLGGERVEMYNLSSGTRGRFADRHGDDRQDPGTGTSLIRGHWKSQGR